ncbi:MAG: MMPL family transporter, partial [Bullifex sp.]|nr:MMPL family transporter [Bullifex sp.]
IFMFFAEIPFDVVTVSFTSIAVGCGVDDAIHFCLRYRNLRKGNPELSVSSAITATIRQTGYPIIITTVSIVFGMMMLSFASYTPIRYFGLLMSITLFGCMVSTILFLPSFMILVDRIKNHFRK